MTIPQRTSLARTVLILVLGCLLAVLTAAPAAEATARTFMSTKSRKTFHLKTSSRVKNLEGLSNQDFTEQRFNDRQALKGLDEKTRFFSDKKPGQIDLSQKLKVRPSITSSRKKKFRFKNKMSFRGR